MSAEPDLIVYDFRSAPEELKALSMHGGDEEWVIVAREGARLPWWFWTPEDNDPLDGSRYGSEWVRSFGGEAHFHATTDGRLIAITAH